MRPVLDALLDRLDREIDDVFFVQIGAMDGVAHDPIHAHIKENAWGGMFVEPLKDFFIQLRANYSGLDNVIFENVAITESDEVRKINRIPLRSIHNSGVPIWAKGISSFFTDRNAIGGVGCSKEIYDVIRPLIVEEDVNCITLETLLARNKIKKIDLLQIDTEGYDFRILKQLDFSRYRPFVINMEFALLPDNEKSECLSLLSAHGYNTMMSSQNDLVATVWDIEKARVS